MTEPLPAHLEDIGRQLTAAAHQLGAPRPRVRRAPRRPMFALPVIAAAAAVAVVLLTTASPATTPAYALVPRGDGTYTLTIHDVETAIPQINAEFAKLGIRAKAVPVTSTCTAPDLSGIPLMGPDKTLSPNWSVTIGNAHIPAGNTGLIAAEQTPAGVRLTLGTVPTPVVPACLNPNQVLPAAPARQ